MKTVYCPATDEQISVGKIVCLGLYYREYAREMMSEVPERTRS